MVLFYGEVVLGMKGLFYSYDKWDDGMMWWYDGVFMKVLINDVGDIKFWDINEGWVRVFLLLFDFFFLLGFFMRFFIVENFFFILRVIRFMLEVI